jgi:hypothetical protein
LHLDRCAESSPPQLSVEPEEWISDPAQDGMTDDPNLPTA